MISFTPYFYKFREMMLNKDIPVEYRAMFIETPGMVTYWKKRYNYNIYIDSDVEYYRKSSSFDIWNRTLRYKIKNITVKNVSSILDMDMTNPEIKPLDLIMLLILYGRGVAIINMVLELNNHIPEYSELKNIVREVKRWNKEKKTIPPPPAWFCQ